LLDRFAHAVDVVGLTKPKDRVEILRRRVFFEQDPDAFATAYEQSEAEMSDRIVAARSRYNLVEYTDKALYTIAALTSSFKVDGHRADIVILKTARAVAAFEDRFQITDRDILLAAELALPHRMKKQPFQDAFLNQEQLEANMRKARSDADEAFGEDDQEASEAEGGSASADEKKVPRAMNRS
jgi:Mg-chelatase subunit ChlI